MAGLEKMKLPNEKGHWNVFEYSECSIPPKL